MKTSVSIFKRPRLFCVLTIVWAVLLLTEPVLNGQPGSIETLEQTGKTFARIAEQASDAVVGIQAEKEVAVRQFGGIPQFPFDEFFFERFFPDQIPQERNPKREFMQRAQGSGFIISSDGYILTNNHLVDKADKVTVKLSDERKYEGEVIGTDPESDVALIKIESNGLPFLKFADSEDIDVGEWVLAVGNPFGFSHSVTAGIISAKGRSVIGVAAYEDFIQTDAAINPGNSGGPLLNLRGQVGRNQYCDYQPDRGQPGYRTGYSLEYGQIYITSSLKKVKS